MTNGEIAKCRICGSVDHFAKACKKKSGAIVFFCPQADDNPSHDEGDEIDEIYLSENTPRDKTGLPDVSPYGPEERAIRNFLSWKEEADVGFDRPAPKIEFVGFVVDSAATKSFCGMPQWQAFRSLGAKTRPVSVQTSGLWAGGRKLGKFLATTSAYEVHVRLLAVQLLFTVHIVAEDIPFLLGLDVQSKYKFVIKPGQNIVYLENLPDHPLPTVRKSLLYIVMRDECFYTEAELSKLHRQFGHASAADLEFVLSRSQKKMLDAADKERLEDIAKRCFICQTYARSPNMHTVSTHIGCVFNHQVFLDAVHLEGLPPVLSMVCRGVRYIRAVVLQNETGSGIWDTFLRCWINVFVGIPHFVIVDSLPANAGDFRDHAIAHGIQVAVAPKEHHQGMGVVERYHEPLRRIYSKLRASQAVTNEALSNETLLSIACKAMNDSSGPEGICPTLCVFGMVPQHALSTSKDPATQQTRLRAQAIAKLEWECETARLRVQLALRQKTPRDPHDETNIVGKPVLVYRRNSPGKPKRWIGPYIVEQVTGKNVRVIIPPLVKDRPGPPTLSTFPMDLVKRFHPSNSFGTLEQSATTSGDELDDNLAMMMDDDQALVSEIIPASKALTSDAFRVAAIKEIVGLFEKRAIEVQRESQVRANENAHVIGGRFIFTLKDAEGDTPKYKARFICQGFGDTYSDEFVVRAPTLSRLGMRIIVTYASILGYKLYFEDCSQAYLQSKSSLTREVYLRVPQKLYSVFESAADTVNLRLPPNTDGKFFFVRVLLPLYGLVESGTHWYTTFASTLTSELALRPAALDPCVLYQPDGMIGLVVDDSIFAGSQNFLDRQRRVMSQFETSGQKEAPYKFNGTTFEVYGTTLILHQKPYILAKFRKSAIDLARKNQTVLDAYRMLRGQLMWLATSTRPDLLFTVAAASRVTAPTVRDLRALGSKLSRLFDEYAGERVVGLRYTPNEHVGRIVVFTDAARSVYDAGGDSQPEIISQLAYVVWYVTTDHSACLLAASSAKSRRQTNSVLAAETFAFSSGYQAGVMCRELFAELLPVRPALDILTDSKSLVDTLSATSITRELTLMSHVAYLREAFALGEIDRVGHVTGTTNYADALTKHVASPAPWAHYYATGRLQFEVTQWIAPLAVSPQEEKGTSVEPAVPTAVSSPPRDERTRTV